MIQCREQISKRKSIIGLESIVGKQLKHNKEGDNRAKICTIIKGTVGCLENIYYLFLPKN